MGRRSLKMCPLGVILVTGIHTYRGILKGRVSVFKMSLIVYKSEENRIVIIILELYGLNKPPNLTWRSFTNTFFLQKFGFGPLSEEVKSPSD